jgi:hypothetical protein
MKPIKRWFQWVDPKFSERLGRIFNMFINAFMLYNLKKRPERYVIRHHSAPAQWHSRILSSKRSRGISLGLRSRKTFFLLQDLWSQNFHETVFRVKDVLYLKTKNHWNSSSGHKDIHETLVTSRRLAREMRRVCSSVGRNPQHSDLLQSDMRKWGVDLRPGAAPLRPLKRQVLCLKSLSIGITLHLCFFYIYLSVTHKTYF